MIPNDDVIAVLNVERFSHPRNASNHPNDCEYARRARTRGSSEYQQARRSTVWAIGRDPTTQWVVPRLGSLISRANQHYRFELRGFLESIRSPSMVLPISSTGTLTLVGATRRCGKSASRFNCPTQASMTAENWSSKEWRRWQPPYARDGNSISILPGSSRNDHNPGNSLFDGRLGLGSPSNSHGQLVFIPSHTDDELVGQARLSHEKSATSIVTCLNGELHVLGRRGEFARFGDDVKDVVVHSRCIRGRLQSQRDVGLVAGQRQVFGHQRDAFGQVAHFNRYRVLKVVAVDMLR